MTTVNHEYYVSLEVAKLLKEAGFKWSCRAAWDLTFPNEPYLNHAAVYPTDFNNDVDDILYAPTLDVAQRWLREVKRIFVTVSVYAVIEQGHEITDSDKFSVYAETWDSQSEFWNKWISLFEIDDFNTYEEAQEAGIMKALEIILEKGK